MDSYTNTMDVGSDSPPSEARLFAQAILGSPIPCVMRAEVRMNSHRAEPQRRAPLSARHAQELRNLQVTECEAQHDRQLLGMDRPDFDRS